MKKHDINFTVISFCCSTKVLTSILNSDIELLLCAFSSLAKVSHGLLYLGVYLHLEREALSRFWCVERRWWKLKTEVPGEVCVSLRHT